MDELLFEALAPRRAKRLIGKVSGFKQPPHSTWRGLDLRTALSVVFVFVTLMWAVFTFMTDQLTVLKGVRDAICAGDIDFVYAVDGMGIVNFACICTAGFEPFDSDRR